MKWGVFCSTVLACMTVASVASAGCLRTGDASIGVLSSESVTIINDCPNPVTFQYCVTSPNGGGAFSCAAGKFGYGSVSANGQTVISVALAGSSWYANWGYCEGSDSDPSPYPANPTWTGASVSVSCR